MSDNSNSTGSSGSSANSWTLLSPEEAAVENVGPVDDGTESLGDVPSLSEEVAGAAMEFKPSDIPIETVLSEEGHQVCQETSPESSEGPVPSSPSSISPLPPNLLDPSDLDLESQPPIIHDIDTSSPSDSDHLGATPFVADIDYGAQLEILAAEPPAAELEEACCAPAMAASELELEAPADIGSDPISSADKTHLPAAEPEVSMVGETIRASGPPSNTEEDFSPTTDSTEPLSRVPKISAAERCDEESLAPETISSAEAEAEEEEESVQKEETQPAEIVTQEDREEEEEPSSSFHLDDSGSFDDDGLRRRHVPPFEAPRPRTSDEEDEEEEAEFRLAERKEEKPWFSLNKCIVGALVLLFLGSLFLSGIPSDPNNGDFDASELSDGEQSQDWLNGDPQDMKELLDKLTQENQQIAQLEAQLQSQKEELDAALTAVAASGDEKGKADLEKENTKLKEELSSLPNLKKELEGLRARVTELSQLTAVQEAPPAAPSSAPPPANKDGHSKRSSAGPESKKDQREGGKLREELQRQKVLLEESGKRLQGMKKDGGDPRRVRENLEEIQRKLSEQVDRWGKKKPQEGKWKGNKGNKANERDHWKKDDKREWKPTKEGQWPKERRDKDERKEKEWKSPKPNSHKESWRRHQDEWERKKGERRVDREERRKEKPWHSKPAKNHHHQQHQHQQQPRKPHHNNDFWRDQEQKLRRNVRVLTGCASAEDCAAKEGLFPVELPEFEELLEGYLSKLEGSPPEGKDRLRRLTADFFEGGVFIHDRALFSDFAEDVADILEDMVDVLGGKDDNDSLEEEMEEFEREALWKFAATP